MNAKPKTKAERLVRSENYIGDLEAITLQLEGERSVEFDLASELRVPTDPDELIEEANAAPARYMFWAAQEQRALRRVRQLERRVAMIEAEYDLKYRTAVRQDSNYDLTERVVRSHVDLDPKVRTQRIGLDRARKDYGMIRSVKEAMDHRAYILRKLITQDAGPRHSRD